MKITKVELMPVTVPYRFPIVHAFGGRNSGDYMIVRIHTDAGVTGVGSGGVLFPMHSGESIDSALANLSYLARMILLGSDPFDIEKLMARVNRALHGHWLTKSSVDFALYDLKGKALDVPVYQLLGGLCRDKVPLEFIVGLGRPDDMADKGREYLDHGFHGLKIKFSGEPMVDLARFAAVRQAAGPDCRVSVDMNEAYTPATAPAVIKAVADMGVAFIEQPVPRRDVRGMREVKDKVDVVLAADEGGWSLDEAAALIQARAADLFHTVPSRIGGFTRALKYRSLIEAYGLMSCISAYNGTGLEHAASSHFIAATHKDPLFPEEPVGILYLFGGYGSDEITGDVIKKTSGRIAEGYLYAPEGPGLGVELDEANIAKYISPGRQPETIE